MTGMRRALVVLALLGVTACGGSADEPAPVAPKVNDDGSYSLGTGVGEADGDAAIKAAVKALPAALSYDYRSLDKGLRAATKLMTPEFGKEFADTFDATTRPMATQKQAITSALVRGAGLVGDAEDGKATVLVYLDQVLVSSKAKKSTDPLKVSQNRVHVQLRRTGDRWLVSDIAPF